MGAIILLSGPVGAGKSTVARELVPQLPPPVSYIDGDTFWSFFAQPVKGSPRERFPVIVRSMIAASVPFARSGFDVVLDFSIPPHFLETARKIVKEIELHYVVLLPSEAVCAQRAAARAEGAIADYGPYREFYSMFSGVERYAVSDGGGAPEVAAARIREGLKAGNFRVP